MLGSIYEHSSPEIQEKTVNWISESCLSQGTENIADTVLGICTNQSLLHGIEGKCEEYMKLKEQGVTFPDSISIEEECKKINSEEFLELCNDVRQGSFAGLNLSGIRQICLNYKSGNLSDKDFFLSLIGEVTGKLQQEENDSTSINQGNISQLVKNKLFLVLILGLLLLGMYLLINDIRLMLRELCSLLFWTGIFIILPYILILAYDKQFGIDTTGLMGRIFEDKNIVVADTIVSLVAVTILSLYNQVVVFFGLACLIAGAFGRAYFKKDKDKKHKRH